VLNKALFDFIDLPKLLNVNSITVKLPIVVSEGLNVLLQYINYTITLMFLKN